MRHHHHGPNCGCPKKIVYPTKCNVVNQFSEETVEHIHPSHTTVVNHHLINNEHVFPHSTSEANTVNSVNHFGGAFEVPPRPGMMAPAPGQVAGAMAPGVGPGIAPGMAPGMNPGMAPGMGVGMNPGMAPGMNPVLGWGESPESPNMMGPGMGFRK